MRRAFALFFTLTLTVGVVAAIGVTGAGAQTGTAAFCQARLDAERLSNEGDKKGVKTALDALAANAPTAVGTSAADLVALYKKKGEKAFETSAGQTAVQRIDAFVSTGCGYGQLSVTAIDYAFQSVPTTPVKSGTTAITLRNSAPAEDHELIVFKRLPGAETTPVGDLLKLSEKKLGKSLEFTAAAAVAPAGGTAVGVANLTPGKYVGVCFLPVGGKKKGAPHFTQGMVTEFTVA